MMKILYASAIVLIALVAAVQNFSLPNVTPLRLPSTYCSAECEFQYLGGFLSRNGMFANFYLPLPSTHQEFISTCNLVDKFLECSLRVTVGCKSGRPPMVRLNQINQTYAYLCNENSHDFLTALPCLRKHYDQEVIKKCVRSKKDGIRRGPDGDLCKELEDIRKCTKDILEVACDEQAVNFMLEYTKRTHNELKRLSRCDRFLPNRHIPQ